MRVKLITTLAIPALFITACEPPPSTQKMIEQEEAKIEAATPRLKDPAEQAAQQAGREYYNLNLIGRWAPVGTCEDEDTSWELAASSFTPVRDAKCRLELVEELNNGSFAAAGYCPRVEFNEPTVLLITQTDKDNIVINSDIGGGPLTRCE